MSSNPTTPDMSWLEKAEAEAAAESEAEFRAERDQYATELANAVNEKLTELGITPLTPASSDTCGNLIPAQVTPEDPHAPFYGVWATFNDDEGHVELHVRDYRPEGQRIFDGLQLSAKKFISVQQVLRARREGPQQNGTERPAISSERPVISPEARAIVQAMNGIRTELRDLRSAVDTVAQNVFRP